MTLNRGVPGSRSIRIELRAEHHGTDANGAKVDDYRHCCFQSGKFTDPDVTMQEMIEKVSSMLAQHSDMTEAQAKEMMAGLVPKLERWRTR